MAHFFASSLKVLLNPGIAVKHIWRRVPLGGIELREKFDAFHKPSYAWGMLRAAKLAKALGLKGFTAIEFGVAQGKGLAEMESIATAIEKTFGIEVDVFGFDSGVGLPPPDGIKDVPYLWKTGDFAMGTDNPTIQALKKAQLVLGDARKTVEGFAGRVRHPIGFISFDFDFYSATKAALQVCDFPDDKILPRVYCYFDDVAGEGDDLTEYAGELLAIKEFNDTHSDRKMSKINGFSSFRAIKSSWNECVYVLHCFDHRDYSRYVVT